MKGAAQRGFSLIELMVASSIGLLILAAMLFVFTGSRQSARHADAMARLQENARIAVELLSAEIRMAGFVGCRSRGAGDSAEPGFEILVSDLPFDWRTLRNAVMSAQYGAGEPAFVDAGALRGVDASHILILRKTLATMVPLAADFSAADGNLQVVDADARAELQAGDLLLIDDCVRGQLLRARSVSAPDGAGVRRIGIDASAAALPYTYVHENFVEVAAVREDFYFVRDSGRRNSAGRPVRALFRMRNAVVDEVVDGVADLRVEFGVGDEDRVEEFKPMEALSETDWHKVRSLRVELLLEADAANVLPEAVSIDFAGATLPASTDLRSVAHFTVALRNRAG